MQVVSIKETYLWLFRSFNFFQDHVLQELNCFIIDSTHYFFQYTQILFQLLESSNSFTNLFNNLHWNSLHSWLKSIKSFLLWTRIPEFVSCSKVSRQIFCIYQRQKKNLSSYKFFLSIDIKHLSKNIIHIRHLQFW